MIQLYAGTLLLLGVTRENINRLTLDKPIKVDVRKPIDKIVIVFGEDKPEIIRRVEALTGIPVPQAIRDEAEKDPL